MFCLLPVLFFLLIPLPCFGAEENIHLTAQDPFVAVLYLSLFLFIGYAFKAIFLRGLMVPSSLLAGLIALSFGPELLGPALSNLFGASGSGFLSPETLLFWKKSPTFLITIVFAGLFLGNKIPSLKQVLKQGAPNLFFGYSLAFGQYVVGLILVIFLLKPMFGISDLAGALIALGFQGGHGTAAGMGDTFSKLGFPSGMDLGLALATIGLASSIIIGTLILNISGLAKNAERVDIKDEESVSSKDEPLHEGGEDRPDIANSLPFHIGVFGFVISIGWLMQRLFITIDQFFSGGEATIMGYVPLFPIAMIAGLIFQFLVERFGFRRYVNHFQVQVVSNIALDFLIVAALGSLSIGALTANLSIVLILAGAGIAWNLLAYYLLARRLFGKRWKVRGLGELGQSMGTTAIGLMLLKQSEKVDPTAMKAFSYKQPLYEPLVGGGLVTALALPMIASIGAEGFLAVTGSILVVVVIASLVVVKPSK